MDERPLNYDDLDAEAKFLRQVLRFPPWNPYGEPEIKTDTATRALFKRYRPGPAPHALSPELRGAVWEHPRALWKVLPDEEEARQRAVNHAALVLHLLARGPAGVARGLDFGAACRNADLTDTRFARLMGTPQPLRLEAMSRVMQRLEKAGASLRWALADSEQQSTRWNATHTTTDEVWAMLNFLFGYTPDRSIQRWAAGFYTMHEDEAEPASDEVV